MSFRSGLEEAIGEQLTGMKVRFEYEAIRIPFIPVKVRQYSPDFTLPNGIIVEAKGQFDTADRQKHLLVQSQHPDLDIRFIFSNSRNRISKQSQTTYAKWCETKGFQYADRLVPIAWLREPRNERSLAAIRRLRESRSANA